MIIFESWKYHWGSRLFYPKNGINKLSLKLYLFTKADMLCLSRFLH